MIPEAHEYLSFLMGAAAISEGELDNLGIKVVQGAGSPYCGLLIPGRSRAAYQVLVREKIDPGFWNDIVGCEEIFFVFKLADGRVEEFIYSEANREQIARQCTALNGDPIEKTSNLSRYLAGNPFYRELMVAFHNASLS